MYEETMALLFTFGMFCTGCATQPEITETETQKETEETTQSKYILNFSDETTTETTSTETETETTDETQTVDLDYATYANYQMSTDTTNQNRSNISYSGLWRYSDENYSRCSPKSS